MVKHNSLASSVKIGSPFIPANPFEPSKTLFNVIIPKLNRFAME
jgi:hypothetical protein